MEKFIVVGGKKLKGKVSVSGAKNVALKAIVAACLTSDEVIIEINRNGKTYKGRLEDLIEYLGGDLKKVTFYNKLSPITGKTDNSSISGVEEIDKSESESESEEESEEEEVCDD